MKIRKVVSTVLIGAMLFFVPSMVPVRAGLAVPCAGPAPGIGWLPTDTAFAVAKYLVRLSRRGMDSFRHGFGPRSLVLLQSLSLAQSPTSVTTGN